MGLKELLESAGLPLDLYSVLGVDKSAVDSEIKKAYHKLALKHHPDKSSAPESTKIFQALSSTYEILKTPEKRSRYDEVGLDDDDSVGMEEPDCGWVDYFKAIFKKVDLGEIEVFKDKYMRSEEERKDIIKYYRICQGDFSKMLECIMLSTASDFEYWKTVIEEGLKEGEVEEEFEIKGFNGEGEIGRVDILSEEEENEKPDNKVKKKGKGKKVTHKKGNDMENLINSIKSKKTVTPKSEITAVLNSKRKNPMEDMIKKMEEKYGGEKKKKKSSHEEIGEEEFERIQREIMERKK